MQPLNVEDPADIPATPRVAPAPPAVERKDSGDVGSGKDYKLENPEDLKVAEGLVGDARTAFIAAIRDIIELNGTGDIPGIQASYIAVSEYVQIFDDLTVSPAMKKALFLAWNWHALGRGVGGLAGSAVRWSLRKYFAGDRETTRHATLPKGSAAIIAEYEAVAKNHHDLVNFFITNAISVAALAGAMVNRIVHHWDSKHTGAQKAFISAMGMADSLPEDQFRPVFYLSIHPIPLSETEKMRNGAAEGKLTDVADVVRLRCVGPPAGYGATNACAAAVHTFLAEPWMNPNHWSDRAVPDQPANPDAEPATLVVIAKTLAHNAQMMRRRENVQKLREEVMRVANNNEKLIKHAGAYHQFATKYGYDKRYEMDTKPTEAAMIVLAAYIFSKVKGSLANSAALRKFRDQHAREVNKRVQAFASIDEDGDAFGVIGI